MNPVPVNISPWGVLFALVFAASMGGLLWWMLHPPKPVLATVAQVRYAVKALKRILVPTIGTTYSEKGVELACRLGKEQEAELILAYVIEVPLTLPLEAPLPQAEIKAKEALTRAEAIVAQHNLSFYSHIERARQAAEGIIRVAKDNDVDLIVVSLAPRKPGKVDKIMGKTTEQLLHRSPVELIVNRCPGEG
ncbi:MAG: universal stress protein [Candidatus Edwardsbacteria bacterium]